MTRHISDTRWAGVWLLLLIVAATASLESAVAQEQSLQAEIQRGRYLVQVSGCNDCHSHGYPESGGQLAEQHWLTGSDLGWRGPWGTTYASNLRQVVQRVNEDQWLKHARNSWRPPMPWFNLRDMADADLLAI